jgi:hypothetical protein
MPIELITPFPEESLPAMWLWLEPYRYRSEFAGNSFDDFIKQVEKRNESHITWGVSHAGELGAYIEFEPLGGRVGMMDFLSKRSFFRPEIAQDACRQVMRVLFAKADLILFDPVAQNKALTRMFRQLGARDVGWMPAADNVPERRILGLTKGEWVNLRQEAVA